MVVIPKSVNPKRIAENFKATQVILDAEEVKRLRDIDKDTRLFRVNLINYACCAIPVHCTDIASLILTRVLAIIEWERE